MLSVVLWCPWCYTVHDVHYYIVHGVHCYIVHDAILSMVLYCPLCNTVHNVILSMMCGVILSMMLYSPWYYTVHGVILSMVLYCPWCYTVHGVILSMVLYFPWCYTVRYVILSMMLYCSDIHVCLIFPCFHYLDFIDEGERSHCLKIRFWIRGILLPLMRIMMVMIMLTMITMITMTTIIVIPDADLIKLAYSQQPFRYLKIWDTQNSVNKTLNGTDHSKWVNRMNIINTSLKRCPISKIVSVADCARSWNSFLLVMVFGV